MEIYSFDTNRGLVLRSLQRSINLLLIIATGLPQDEQ